MSDYAEANPGAGGPKFATDILGGVNHPYAKLEFGADGSAIPVSEDNPLPTQAVGELIEAIEAMRMAINALKKTIGSALPNAQGFPIMEVRQSAAGNLIISAQQNGTWNIATLTNQTQIGGFAANDQVPAFFAMRAASFRRNITVT
jgi:hypothetical protein